MTVDELLPLARLRRVWRAETELVRTVLVQLVAALVVGDCPVVVTALKAAQGLRVPVNSKVYTPFGGASLFPLQAAVGAPLDSDTLKTVVRRLLELGANPNVHWRDCGGEFTPLAKALSLRAFWLANLLVQHGADCTAALLCTDLLERSRFDASLIKWLLDRGAVVAPPCDTSASSTACSTQPVVLTAATPGVSSSSSGFLPDKAQPIVAVLLKKLATELHVSRELSRLHAAAGSGQEQWLLQRARESLTLLLAAGALPAGPADPTGAFAAAVAELQPCDWAAVKDAASNPPRWSPLTHHLFPPSFHCAVREVLLAARHGFPVALVGRTAGQRCQPSQPHMRPTQQHDRVYLDGNVVNTIIKYMAPYTQT